MDFLKKIVQTDLFRITSINSFSVALKIAIGLITSKLLAVFVGPNGMALVGNLRNFVSSLESIAVLGFTNGIVKYVAEDKEDKIKLRTIISTVFITVLLVTGVLSCILFLFSEFWNTQVFGDNFRYELVFKAAALLLPFYALSVFLLALINGLGKFKKVIGINIAGNIISLIVSLYMILHFRTTGALLSMVIAPALLFFVTFYTVSKEFNFLESLKWRYFDFKIIKKLSAYTVMALVSSGFGPLVYLAIRKNVMEVAGVQQAGFWETVTRISIYYMMFVTTILSVYFFPKLVAAKNNEDTKIIFRSFYKNIMPVFTVCLLAIYFFRVLIIKSLFTEEFLPVTDLFFWQLLGDFFKAASWVLGFQFFAKKMTAPFIITEMVSLGILYFLSTYLLEIFGIQGIVMAQAIDNLVYLIVLGVYFRKSLF